MLHAPLPGCRQRAWPCSLLGKRTWWWWEFDRDLGSAPKLPRSGGCSLPGGGLPQHLSQLVLTSGIIAMSLVSLDVLCSIAVRGVEEINVFIVVAGQQLWHRMEEMGISREHTEMVSLLGVGMLQDPRVLHPTVPQPRLPVTRPSALHGRIASAGFQQSRDATAPVWPPACGTVTHLSRHGCRQDR